MKNNQGQCCFSPMKVSLLHFLHSSELTTVGDDDGALGLAALRAELLHLSEDLHAGGNLSEDGVLAIKVGEGIEAKEELGAVGVGAGVGHGEVTGSSVLAVEVLIGELLAVDGFSTGSVETGEVTALGHEAGDDSVEGAALEVEGLS